MHHQHLALPPNLQYSSWSRQLREDVPLLKVMVNFAAASLSWPD